MFQSLPLWLVITLALLALLIVFFIIRAIKRFFTQLFQPFKKGKRYWCKVIAVSDGDTITCKRLNIRRSVTKVRLAYVDAPESSQAFGKEAQKMVVDMVYKKMVRIRIVDADRYGRYVAEVYRRGKHVNEELIKKGGAWVYTDYIKNKSYAERLNKLQSNAKKDKRGLWKASRPMNPSDYRKAN